MTSVLVLGADDAVGRRIVETLCASAWATPYIFCSESTFTHARLKKLDGSPRDDASLAAACSNADAIVAAFSGSPDIIRQRARALFQSPALLAEKRVVNLSSMTVYGRATGVVTERTPVATQLSDYARARLEAEDLSGQLPNVVTFRLGVEYGPGCIAWSERVASWLKARRIGDLGAFGDGYCNLVHVNDIANATLRALEPTVRGGQIMNLAAPDPITWNDYFLAFGKALGAVPVRRITRRRLRMETKLLASPLKIAGMFSGGFARRWPALPPSALTAFSQEIMLNSERASRELRLAWTPLSEGLQQTAGRLSR